MARSSVSANVYALCDNNSVNLLLKFEILRYIFPLFLRAILHLKPRYQDETDWIYSKNIVVRPRCFLVYINAHLNP